MDTDRLRVTLETTAIRLKTQVRLAVQALGAAVAILAGFNLVVGGPLGGVFTVYRELFDVTTVAARGDAVIHLADLLLLVVGLFVLWKA